MGSETSPRIWRWLLAELLVGAIALWATGLLAPELQPIARIASGCALLAGLVALFAVHQGLARGGTGGLFAGISIGFFARMLMLAVGLLGSHARGEAALTFAFTFFAIYACTAGAEVAYVITRARSLPARPA